MRLHGFPQCVRGLVELLGWVGYSRFGGVISALAWRSADYYSLYRLSLLGYAASSVLYHFTRLEYMLDAGYPLIIISPSCIDVRVLNDILGRRGLAVLLQGLLDSGRGKRGVRGVLGDVTLSRRRRAGFSYKGSAGFNLGVEEEQRVRYSPPDYLVELLARARRFYLVPLSLATFFTDKPSWFDLARRSFFVYCSDSMEYRLLERFSKALPVEARLAGLVYPVLTGSGFNRSGRDSMPWAYVGIGVAAAGAARVYMECRGVPPSPDYVAWVVAKTVASAGYPPPSIASLVVRPYGAPYYGTCRRYLLSLRSLASTQGSNTKEFMGLLRLLSYVSSKAYSLNDNPLVFISSNVLKGFSSDTIELAESLGLLELSTGINGRSVALIHGSWCLSRLAAYFPAGGWVSVEVKAVGDRLLHRKLLVVGSGVAGYIEQFFEEVVRRIPAAETVLESLQTGVVSEVVSAIHSAGVEVGHRLSGGWGSRLLAELLGSSVVVCSA